MRNVPIIIFLSLVVTSCIRSSKDIPEYTPESASRGIISSDSVVILDTSAILRNDNVNRLRMLIEQTALKEDTLVGQINSQVWTFLKKLTKDSFSITNANERWQDGCFVTGLPKRKLKYLGQSNRLTVMTYYTGGWGQMEHIIIVEHKGKKILDFWWNTGQNLNSKDSILKYLKHPAENYGNLIYF